MSSVPSSSSSSSAPCGPIVPWDEEPTHRLRYSSRDLRIFSGTLAPFKRTLFHSHVRPTAFVVLSTATAENELLAEDQVRKSIIKLTCGEVLYYDGPVKHRVRGFADRLWFVGVEIGEDVEVEQRKGGERGWVAVEEIRLEKGEARRVESKEGVLGRVIVGVEESTLRVGEIVMQMDKGVFVVVRKGLQSGQGGTELENVGPQPWFGIVIDIIGKRVKSSTLKSTGDHH